jgi:hypothetical protein
VSAENWQDFKAIETTNNIYFVDAIVKALCVAKWKGNNQPKQMTFELFWLIITTIFGQTNSFYYLCG